MARGDVKVDPRPIVAAHYGSLVSASTGERRIQDHLWLEGLPVAIGVACLLGGVRLPAAAATGLLTANGLLGGFLFGATLQISGRAMTWADSGPPPGPATSEEATFLAQLTANAGYAALVAVVTAITFVGASASKAGSNALLAWSALGLGMGAHVVLTLFMVLKRVHVLTQRRLVAARTGGHEDLSG